MISGIMGLHLIGRGSNFILTMMLIYDKINSMKICSSCKKEKPFEEFNKKGQKRLQSNCRICDRKISKEYYEKNKEKQKKQIYASKKIRVAKIKKYIQDLKSSTPCMDCKKTYPYYVMDFDHQHSKEFLISKAVESGRSLEAIKKEIEKCEIVCANCHRIRTYS